MFYVEGTKGKIIGREKDKEGKVCGRGGATNADCSALRFKLNFYPIDSNLTEVI